MSSWSQKKFNCWYFAILLLNNDFSFEDKVIFEVNLYKIDYRWVLLKDHRPTASYNCGQYGKKHSIWFSYVFLCIYMYNKGLKTWQYSKEYRLFANNMCHAVYFLSISHVSHQMLIELFHFFVASYCLSIAIQVYGGRRG